MSKVTAVILAGGRGSRLEPLTRDRAKPAVPFGGSYRIIDFALSNCVNSALKNLLVLTQYKAISLDRHINDGWRKYFCPELGESIDILPPQQRIDEHFWYQGTADAVYQNIYTLEQHRPDLVIILAGDHIYKMNYRHMIDFHVDNQADLTIAALTVDRESARQFGVMQIGGDQRVVGFTEKPESPVTIPGTENECMASMGIYVFSTRFLYEQLLMDANDPESSHDFGKDIIPAIIESDRVFAFPFQDENRKSEAYWRDVGTLDAYYDANIDLINADPLLNLYDHRWPVRSRHFDAPPPKFVFGSSEEDIGRNRIGSAIDSVVCPGTVVSGGFLQRCVISPYVRINSFAQVSDSILFDGVEVGRNARIKRAIIDKNVKIPAGMEIGFDPEADRARGFEISPGGVVVIGKSHSIHDRPAVPAPRFQSAHQKSTEHDLRG